MWRLDSCQASCTLFRSSLCYGSLVTAIREGTAFVRTLCTRGFCTCAGLTLLRSLSARGIRRDVDFIPAIGWCQAEGVKHHALHARLSHDVDLLLLHREPGHEIDQFLLDLVVSCQATSRLGQEVGGFHLGLHRLLI